MINKKLQKPTYSEIINYPFLPARNAIEKLDYSKIKAPTYVSLTGDSSGETTAPGIAYGAFGSLNGDLPAVELPPSKDEIDALIQGHKLPSWRDALQRETVGNDSQTAVGTPEGAGDTIVETEPKPQAMTFEEYILSLKSKADDAYKQSVANAELERQRASVDAQNAYDRGRSAYGSNAEALSAMGLTGSGYGQYLDSKAYAQMRGDMNAANALKSAAVTDAEARRDNAYAQADASYMDYLNTQETNKKNAYVSMLGTITADTPLSEIENLANAYGLSPEQIETLKATRNDKILNAGTYTKDDLIEMFGEGTPKFEEYFKKIQDDAAMLDSSAFYDEEGNLRPKSEVAEFISGYKQAGVDTTELEKEFNDKYTAKTAGVTFNNDGGVDNPGKAGNNFSVKAMVYPDKTSGGRGSKEKKIFRVEYTGEEVSDAAKQAGSDLDDNTVFKYDGNLYVKRNGQIYAIGARPLWNGHYEELLNLFTEPKE